MCVCVCCNHTPCVIIAALSNWIFLLVLCNRRVILVYFSQLWLCDTKQHSVLKATQLAFCVVQLFIFPLPFILTSFKVSTTRKSWFDNVPFK